MHADEIPFLNAILQSPNDDVPRLIYADWLEERGDLRATFLRLEVEFAHRKEKRQSARDLVPIMNKIANGMDSPWSDLLSTAGTTPADVFQELCLVDGQGRIEVLGDKTEAVLMIEGKPIAFNWDDCQGSVGQYLVQTGQRGNEDFVGRFREFVSGSFEGIRIVAHVDALLVTFASGVYRVVYTPSKAMGSWSHIISIDGLQNYYPSDRNLIWTQPQPMGYQNRIGAYRDQIRDGLRPVVLTTSVASAWCEFVIDGHHKLEAYYREHVSPTVLSIERWDASPINLPLGVSFFPPNHPGISEYQRMKRGGI